VLQSDLLSVWKRKGELIPRYARPSPENIDAARNLIETYQAHIGEKKKSLKTIVTELEGKGFEYRFIRGLSSLLDRKSRFSCDCKVDPVELRRRIFQATQTHGLPTTAAKRKEILEVIASETKLSAVQVEEAFYGDLDGELVLREVAALSPAELLTEYNLSLTQTLLFSCTELSFSASGNWQRIFYVIKKLGLIYDVTRENGFTVKIDGPASLFKLTRRYGVAIAKLLPVIVTNLEWIINAKVFWKYDNEICNFKIDNQKHGALLKKPNLPIIKYDSEAEEKFASQFGALSSGWTLKREPEPVPAGRQVIIPDFSMERGGVKIYLELMGFWTEGYLLRKIEKLKQVDHKMLLLIDEALACEKLSALKKREQLNLIFYHNKIPWTKVLKYLETTFEETKKREIEFLQTLPIKFTEPILQYDEFAARTGVSTEAVKTVLTTNPPPDYVAFPNLLVSKEKLTQIGKLLDEQMPLSGKMPLLEATQIIETQGISDTTTTLTTLNYRINWHGINTQQAQITKLQNQKTN
jgi:predicted nuclease of restriction endonuclease-like RecB superfamily